MKILLGMSGGIDSTFAAKMLLDAGNTVEGAVVLMHEYTELEEAEKCASALGIPLHVIDMRRTFEETVIRNFENEYRSGRTPNPCIICNGEVKFKALYDFALSNGFDKIATGHYAKIEEKVTRGGIRYSVKRGEDLKKDQSYVLWRLSQEILSMLLLPLADMKKTNVREAAKEISLPAADRADSLEICFVPSGDYAEFIEMRTGKSEVGNFIDTEGNVLGKHKGIIRYTHGQRKGLGISAKSRMFVADIDPETNNITLSYEDKSVSSLSVSGAVFSGMCEPSIGGEVRSEVKLRYLAPPAKCTAKYLGNGNFRVTLDTPQRAVTPGQSAVFYDFDSVLFGAFINSADR